MNAGTRTIPPTAGTRLVLALAAIALALAGCASTGSIQGLVAFPSVDNRQAVVTAWRTDLATPPHVGGRAQAVIVDGRFVPTMLVVSPGTTVMFTNHDRVFHVPFSASPSATFDLGGCASGSTRAVTFDQPGVVEIYCALHPREFLYVVVSPDRWHTQPAADGSFMLNDVPYGTYYVRAWHPALGEVTARVRVDSPTPAQVTLRR